MESPRPTPRVAGKTGHPEPPAWVRARAIPFDGEAEMVRDLRARGATASRLDVFWYLADACRRYDRPGTYESLRTMVDKSGIPITTLRHGIKWLEREGLVAISEEMAGRRVVRVKWCLWLLPSGRLDRESFDLGQGVMSGCQAATIPGHGAPQGARFPDPAGARFPDPKDSKWISFESGKTTDVGNVVVESAPLDRGDGGTRAVGLGDDRPAPAAVDPVDDLDPAIAATLDAEFPDAGERAELAAEVPGWLARCAVEWVVKLILETAAARAKRKVHSLAGFAGGTLANWIGEGKPTLRAARSKLPPSGKTPEVARAEAEAESRSRAEKARAAAGAEAARLAEEAATGARWDALTPEDRASIEARVRLSNPGSFRFKAMFRSLCLAAMDDPG